MAQQQQRPQQPQHVPASSGETVTVACKLPSGLLLRVFDFEEIMEPVLGGGTRTSKRAVLRGEPIRINGNAVPFGEIPDGEDWTIAKKKGDLFTNGYGITRGVPKDFWELWLRQNAESPMVKNNLVFAVSSVERARDQAKDQSSSVWSGFEPLIPNEGKTVDRRAPKRVQKAKLKGTEEEEAA